VHRTLFERVERMRRFRSLVEDARAQASTDHPALRRRLAELVTAYGQSIDALNRVLADWPTTRAS
jgi:hypothetical protein